MKPGLKVAGAIGVGYLLGRNHKMRMALTLGTVAAAGQLGRAGDQLKERAAEKVTSSDTLGKLAEPGKRLLEAGEMAAMAAVTGRIDAVSDQLHERAETLRNSGAADEDEEAGGPANEEAEAEPKADKTESKESKSKKAEGGKTDGEKAEGKKPKAKESRAKKTEAKKAEDEETEGEEAEAKESKAKKADAEEADGKKPKAKESKAKKTKDEESDDEEAEDEAEDDESEDEEEKADRASKKDEAETETRAPVRRKEK